MEAQQVIEYWSTFLLIGTTITIPLIIHAPIDMSDITDPLIGTTKEMNDLSSKIEQALKSPWSKLRMNGSVMVYKYDTQQVLF